MRHGNRPRMAVLAALLAACLPIGKQMARADVIFGEPTNLGPSVNSGVSDFDCSISSDGLCLVFSSSRPPGNAMIYDFDLWMTTRETKQDPWGPAEYLGDVLNSQQMEMSPWLSPDGLALYYARGPRGDTDIHVSRRNSPSEPWRTPENLGPTVNSSSWDAGPSMTADGLELYFNSSRSGKVDLYVSTRPTTSDPWGEAVNLGPTVNSIYGTDEFGDLGADISPDGLTLIFSSLRPPGGMGNAKLWVTRRGTRDGQWEAPVLLALPDYETSEDFCPSFRDGVLYFSSTRVGWWWDLWQVEVQPVFDFNGDTVVDTSDVYELLENWGTDASLCDIAPSPFGDGIVDAQDLAALAEYMIKWPK